MAGTELQFIESEALVMMLYGYGKAWVHLQSEIPNIAMDKVKISFISPVGNNLSSDTVWSSYE